MENIGIYENVLDKEFCEKIINYFEKSDKLYDGVTGSGLDKNIKNTKDLHLSHDKDNDEAIFIDKILNEVNSKYIKIYLSKYQKTIYKNKKWRDHGFQLQRYRKNEGQYVYHVDESIEIKNNEMRVLTYLYYLNDVDEGGETEFLYTIKVKPETGKLVIFPASWCYPHKAFMPISNDKYIVTGWLYCNIN